MPLFGKDTRPVRGDFDDIVDRTRLAVSKEGFGVLTEINMQKTLEAKLAQRVQQKLEQVLARLVA